MKKLLFFTTTLLISNIIKAQPCPAITGFSVTSPSCFGLPNGAITINYTSGTAPYTVAWSNPISQTITSTALTQSVSSVAAGNYVVTLSDNNGCVTSQSLNISEPMSLIMTTSSFSNVSCFGGSNGQVSTTVQGGTPGYTYSWSPPQSGNTGLINGLIAGGYSLIVVDANNCSINASFNITEPSVLTTTYTSLPATCGLANGSATLVIGGGTPTYSIGWNLPGFPTGTSVTNVSPGTWIANVTDLKGCTHQQTVSITSSPFPTITGFSKTSPSCFGLSNGNITINYTPGTAPYTVTWSNPISQTLTTSALTQSVSGVAAGNYSVTLTDNNGCTTSQQINVTNPPFLSFITIPDPTICYGQTTQLYASGQGGTPSYSYSWSPNPFVGGGPHAVNPNTTTTYTVAMSDANGCSTSARVITVNVMPPLSAIGNAITICDGESAVLTPTIVSGGSGGPYAYSWSPSMATSNSITVIGNAPTGPTTNTYVVVVDDGCTIPSASITFTVNANICTGVTELTNSSLSVYPNPTSNFLNIEFLNIPDKGVVELYNTIGELMFSEKLNNKNNTINTSQLNYGMYYIRVVENNKVIALQKIVKQ